MRQSLRAFTRASASPHMAADDYDAKLRELQRAVHSGRFNRKAIAKERRKAEREGKKHPIVSWPTDHIKSPKARVDFTAAAANSTRPKAGNATTFHFKHETLAKNKLRQHGGLPTGALLAAHQDYLERGSAILADGPKATHIPELGAFAADNIAAHLQVEAARLQAYMEEGDVLVVDGRPVSFGSIGPTLALRTDYWQKVFDCARTNGRVQMRLVNEIPH